MCYLFNHSTSFTSWVCGSVLTKVHDQISWIKIICAGRMELCAVPDSWTRILYLRQSLYGRMWMQGVDALQNTHFFFKIWLCYCLPQDASDQVYVTDLKDLFMSPCVCVCVCVCVTSLKKVDTIKCKLLYRINLNTTLYVLTESGWQKLRPLTELYRGADKSLAQPTSRCI
jgi:hypothetical protein